MLIAVISMLIDGVMTGAFLGDMERIRNAYLICIANHLAIPAAAGLVLAAAAPLRDIWLCFVIGHSLCLIVTWYKVQRGRKNQQAV